jgi:hypothetical protein
MASQKNRGYSVFYVSLPSVSFPASITSANILIFQSD